MLESNDYIEKQQQQQQQQKNLQNPDYHKKHESSLQNLRVALKTSKSAKRHLDLQGHQNDEFYFFIFFFPT